MFEKVISVKVSSESSDALNQAIEKSQLEKPEFLRALIDSASNFSPLQKKQEEVPLSSASMTVFSINRNLEKIVSNQELYLKINQGKPNTIRNLEYFFCGVVIGAIVISVLKAA